MRLLQGGERASVVYLHNALGQRVFKSAPEFDFHAPREDQLGMPFVGWLRRQYGWLFTPDARGHARLGEAFVYGDGEIPAWALLGSYDNGTVQAHGRSEFIWLPTEDGGAIPIGLYRNEKLYAVQGDHLGTPRVITDQRNQPVWQWPYSGFGDNQPVGVLKAGDKDRATVLKGSKPLVEVNLRFPGQYFDEEAGLTYNLMRSYDQRNGRYSQADPIGLEGGLNRFAYVSNSPLTAKDPLGLWTVQLGFSISGAWMPTVFGIGPTGQVAVGIAFDGNGNAGGYWTAGAGAAVGTTDVVGGAQAAWSNGDTICDLGGVSSNVGINAGWGWGGTVDTFGGRGTRNQPVGGIGVTIGGGAGVAGYAGKSYTEVKKFGRSANCTCQ